MTGQLRVLLGLQRADTLAKERGGQGEVHQWKRAGEGRGKIPEIWGSTGAPQLLLVPGIPPHCFGRCYFAAASNLILVSGSHHPARSSATACRRPRPRSPHPSCGQPIFEASGCCEGLKPGSAQGVGGGVKNELWESAGGCSTVGHIVQCYCEFLHC